MQLLPLRKREKKSYLQKRPLLHYSFLIQYLKRRGSTYDALQVILTRKKMETGDIAVVNTFFRNFK